MLELEIDRFEEEIAAFEWDDEAKGHQEDVILFVGSSSIRMWESLEVEMEGLNVLNRGFGGGTMHELNDYWPRIIGKHQPSLVVVYCGENDLAEGADTISTTYQITTFLQQVKTTLPTIPILYIAMKPSLDRITLWPTFQAIDQEVMLMVDKTENLFFLDLSATMLADGTLKPDIFEEDGLHMNPQGYAGWTSELKPVIKKLLK